MAAKATLWIGRVLSGLVGLMLLFSAFMKFKFPPEAAEGFAHLGWKKELAWSLGIIEIACTIIYLIPQTAVLGAILLAGYLGGATATHVRVGDATWFGPIIVGVVAWLGLYLREPRLRSLVPIRK
jgi:hypothetical protein